MADPELAKNAAERFVQFRDTFLEYIGNNTESIENNLPVFYTHSLASFNESFPDADDDLFNSFIDSITCRILETSASARDKDFISRLCYRASENKKGDKDNFVIDVSAGMRLLMAGNHTEVIKYLADHRKRDITIIMALAYSSLLRDKVNNNSGNCIPGDGEIAAREIILKSTIGRQYIDGIRMLPQDSQVKLNNIFWHMLEKAMEWFPVEPNFILTALRKSVNERFEKKQQLMMNLAGEKFPDDRVLMFEVFNIRFSNRELGLANNIVTRLMKRYPNDMQVIYMGMKLSLECKNVMNYRVLRDHALKLDMPPKVIDMMDLGNKFINATQYDANQHLIRIINSDPRDEFYYMLLQYLLEDYYSPDKERSLRAKKKMLRSIDNYCAIYLNKAKNT